MLLKTVVEKEIDIDEVLNCLMDYESDAFLWYTSYRDALSDYEADERIILENNAATVLKACIDLYIQKLQQYRDEDLEEEIKHNPF